MNRTSARNILASVGYGAGFAVIVAAVRSRNAREPFAVPELLPILLLIVAAGILLWGRAVAASKQRDDHGRRHREVSPLHAARVAILSQACLRVGAGLGGFFTLCVPMFLLTGNTDYVTHQAVFAALTAVASAVLAVCSWFAEKWCLDDSEGSGHAGASAGAGA